MGPAPLLGEPDASQCAADGGVERADPEDSRFACRAADTAPGNANTEADGQRRMGELALWTGAAVIAGRDDQYYCRDGYREEISPFRWRGPMYEFRPESGQAGRFGRVPEWYKPAPPPTNCR